MKSDKGSTIVIDDAGYTYITGYYNEIADFGPFNTGFSFSSSKEVFVAKIDPLGNYVWVKNGTNYYDDRGLGLCLDPQGNIFVTGTCWGGMDWGSLSVYNATSYTDQIFILKLDNNGNELWLKVAGNDETSWITAPWDPFQTLYNDDHGYDIASDSQGNIFVTGYISSIHPTPTVASFDAITIPLNYGDTLGYVAKMTNDGTWQWVKTFGGVHLYRDNAIGLDDEDNVYVAGGFKGTRTFGTDVLNSNNNSLDIYVVKYDNAGNYQYVVQVGDTLDDRADGITYGNDGHMYVTGEFRGEAFFGTDDLNNYGGPEDKDIFVAKIAKDGDWVWASKAGSTKGGDRGIGICANNQGNIYVSGQFKNVATFGSFQIDSGTDSVHFFVSMIDTAGIWQWVLNGGGLFNKDRASSVACDEDCNVYYVGRYYNTLTAGPNTLNSSGGYDIMVGKIADACDGQAPPDPPGTEPEPEPEVENCEVVPTNVFSPNGDLVNDYLVFSETCNITSHIVIVNRWGNVVFESNDLLQPWNGKDQLGLLVNDGVYFYNIDLEYKNGITDNKNGFITIVK